MNGFIDGNGADGIEMLIAGITDVHIHNITISNAVRGINLTAGVTRLLITDTVVAGSSISNLNLISCNDVLIERCMFNGAVSGSLNNIMNSCTNVRIIQSSFDNNVADSFIMFNCTDVDITGCSFDNNVGVGMTVSSLLRASIVDSTFNNNSSGFFSLSSNSRCYEFARCTASENTNDGFLLTNTFACVECIACGNGSEGFRINSTTGTFCIEGCIAKVNDTGFFAVSGAEGVVKECMAVGNASCGFNDATSATAVTYGANLAQSNGTGNYCVAGVPVAPAVLPYFSVGITGAAYWDNISA